MGQRHSTCPFCWPAGQPGPPDFWFIFQPCWPRAVTWTTENVLAWGSHGRVAAWSFAWWRESTCTKLQPWQVDAGSGEVTLQVLSMPPTVQRLYGEAWCSKEWNKTKEQHYYAPPYFLFSPPLEQECHLSISLFVQRPQLLGQQDHQDHQNKTPWTLASREFSVTDCTEKHLQGNKYHMQDLCLCVAASHHGWFLMMCLVFAWKKGE